MIALLRLHCPSWDKGGDTEMFGSWEKARSLTASGTINFPSVQDSGFQISVYGAPASVRSTQSHTAHTAFAIKGLTIKQQGRAEEMLRIEWLQLRNIRWLYELQFVKPALPCIQ